MRQRLFSLIRPAFFLCSCLALFFALPGASADELAFAMPKIAPWPQSAIPLPSLIAEKDLADTTRKAEAGDADAQYQLAIWYSERDKTTGETRNLELAGKWVEKAAENGNPHAMFAEALSKAPTTWPSDEKSMEETLALIIRAANAGSGRAAHIMGQHYQKGQDTSDIPKAILWYRKAVENGFALSALELGEIYFPMRERHMAVRPDIINAYAWRVIAQRAFNDGKTTDATGILYDSTDAHIDSSISETNTDTLTQLQLLMLPSEKKAALAILAAWPQKLPPEGDTSPVPEKQSRSSRSLDEAETAALMKQVESGDKKALHEFITLLMDGLLPVKNEKDIAALLLKASARGMDEAVSLLGWLTIKGLGVEKNEAKGRAMLQAQAKKGDPRACYLMGLIEREASGENDKPQEKALSWFKKGAAIGDTASMLMLAAHYQADEKDRKKTAYWLEKAAETGNERALMELLGIAESDRDIMALVKWTALIILRTEDPMTAWRSRGILLWLASGADYTAFKQALADADRWHQAHPLPAKKDK